MARLRPGEHILLSLRRAEDLPLFQGMMRLFSRCFCTVAKTASPGGRRRSLHRAIFDEVRAYKNAARVRDFGDADIAGYARMARAYAFQADALGTEKLLSPPITPVEIDEVDEGALGLEIENREMKV